MACSVVGSAQLEYTPDMVKSTTKNVKNITKYTANDDSVWEVGGDVTFGNATGNDSFIWVNTGDGIMTPFLQAHTAWGGKTTEIKKIRISGSKKMGYTLYVTCKAPGQPITINLEKAIEVGEVVTSGYTSDKALKELKTAKDKLDLGLITQEEFDRIREELAPYIK
jgi:hypothetical protein